MPVSLQNLLNIGRLKAHPPDAAELQRPLREGNMQKMHIASAAKPSLMRSYLETVA